MGIAEKHDQIWTLRKNMTKSGIPEKNIKNAAQKRWILIPRTVYSKVTKNFSTNKTSCILTQHLQVICYQCRLCSKHGLIVSFRCLTCSISLSIDSVLEFLTLKNCSRKNKNWKTLNLKLLAALSEFLTIGNVPFLSQIYHCLVERKKHNFSNIGEVPGD